jgi:hypothetical protein
MMTSSLRWVLEMMMSDDKVGGWVKKGQNHDDVILEWSLVENTTALEYLYDLTERELRLMQNLHSQDYYCSRNLHSCQSRSH